MLRAGDRVGDRYAVIERIAEGGMGTLWRAHHVELHVDVVLKVLSVDAASPDLLKRFKREAQAAARLRSPNIVQILDYGVHEGQPYLAMELLRGEDLAERITREGRLSIEETLRIMQAVARGMQLAHDADIVHRDVKPANIFLEKVGDEEVVKLLDFGVAKDLGPSADPSATTGGAVIGSPAYMSPEQVWGEEVDRRTDVWAMAVVTVEMLTGRCPFADETLAKIFERIIRAPLPKISELNNALPSSLDAFFDKALARARADRIASSREFADLLRRALESPPAPRVSSPASDAPTVTRDRSPLVATAVRPPAPRTDAEEAAGSSRRRAPRLLSLLAVAALGVGIALRLAWPPAPVPATRREVAERGTAAPTSAGSSARDAPPGALTGVQGSGSAVSTSASASTAPPVKTSRPFPSTAASARRAASAPAAASARGADPTFGIPLGP